MLVLIKLKNSSILNLQYTNRKELKIKKRWKYGSYLLVAKLSTYDVVEVLLAVVTGSSCCYMCNSFSCGHLYLTTSILRICINLPIQVVATVVN